MSAIVEGILKFIEKNINPKIGIVLFGASLTGILLLKAEIVPASDIPKGTMTLLVLAACLGGWIMLAIGIMKGHETYVAYDTRTKAQSKAELDQKAKDQNAIDNLPTLNDQELETLVFLLRRGQQRFSEHSKFVSGLRDKGMVRPTDTSYSVSQVVPAIWDRREELLKRYGNVRTGREIPRSFL
jgi:hypothetical protein